MQVSVETTSELSRKLTVQVPEEEIQEKIATRLRSLANQIKIDGFRPGKVPQTLVKKRYGQQVREEVLSDLIQSSFYEAVREEKLRPAGVPQITARKIDEGSGLEYEASFEVMPEFVLMPLETLEVKRFVSEVTEEDVDGMIERLREQRKTWQEVERAAATGDRVTISFEGKIGEESFTDGKVENLPVVLGTNQMIPGFEEKLVGSTAGSVLEFELSFPTDYPNEKLAGNMARFAVEPLKVEESLLPEVNEEFAKSYGIEEGGVEAFRTDIRANMEREMKRALQTKSKTSVMDTLFAKNTIALPNALIQDELNHLLKPYREMAEKRRQDFDEAKMKEKFEPMARRRVALALILGKIIETNNLVVDQKRVRSTVEELATSYESPEDVVRWYYAEPERLREVENVVMEDQVVDLVLDKAKVTEEKIAFQELMQPDTGSSSQAA
ncbi:trigger factor [Methylocaldum marinum]|uniref:Trigger factor n=1 Tax=Methylocaldum marinum TaxID=1432792 RepID=A0A250KSN0_9GAMM|nr:trigger factor [Methylocaldum marinum]BBA34546.1 trigger factor [Methylocaldum marinum]